MSLGIPKHLQKLFLKKFPAIDFTLRKFMKHYVQGDPGLQKNLEYSGFQNPVDSTFHLQLCSVKIKQYIHETECEMETKSSQIYLLPG